jgi:hypothetical protein
MRHVFPTSEIPHLWAHQSQGDGRNPQGNLFFQGPTIYSYRQNWPLARIYTHPTRGKLVLTNSERYSVTTAAHQSAVNRSASHLPCVAVPQCIIGDYTHTEKQDHALNLGYFAEQITEQLAKAKRAVQISTVNWRTASAQSRYQDALDYSAFFGIRRKVAPFPAAEFDAARERAQRIETPDPVRDAAKIRARERKRIATLAAFDLKRTAWRENTGAPYHRLTRRERQQWRELPVMLRVSGDQIESSMGARIPLEHAPRLWRLIQACRSSGRAYARNGHTEHAGTYAIDAISAEGELRAGCHTIPYAELELLARTLGLLGDASEPGHPDNPRSNYGDAPC